MTVNVFGSKINAEPHETYAAGGLTVGEWLRAEVPDFEAREVPPISVAVNGQLVSCDQWDSTHFEVADVVDITLEPKGSELFFGALFLVAIRAMTPKIPKVSSQTASSGDDINQASIKGNKVKINSPIREVFGQRKVYPDYLLPPRRFFAGPREQRVQLMLCIGKGEYDIPSNRVLIGDTPALSLGADVVTNIYAPGADVSADPCHLWWHDVTEVGSSSNGSAGLELTIATTLTPGFVATSLQFNAYTVSIPSGGGTFPADWTTGLLVRIIAPYSYEFVDGGVGRDIIRGTALAMLAPSVGDLIEIAGINGGLYVVNSYTPGTTPEMTLNFDDGTPVTALTLGTITSTIGPRGLRYRVTVFSTSQITIERLKGTGATDTSFPGFSFLQTASGLVTLDATSLQGGYRGPFALSPINEKCTAFEWDVFFGSGLVGLGSKGEQYALAATHYLEWRDMDLAGAWTVETRTVVAASLDSVGYTFRMNTPYPMRVEARIRRSPKGSTEWQDSAVWYGARSLLTSPVSYPGVTTISVDARGGDRLSAQSESQISVEVTRKLPVRLGGFWQPPQPTRDIAAGMAYLVKSIGYTDADLDLLELDRLNEVWKARGDHFDQMINTTSTVKSVLNDALAAGFAEVSVERGKLRPVRDEPRTQFESIYTPQNFTAGDGLDRSFTAISQNDYDGVDVEYTDNQSWQVATVACRLPGDLGQKVQKITAEGITNRTKAWQLGMRQRRSLRYRRWTFKWSTELDALNSRYLSYVQVADDIPGYAQSAIMVDYDPVARVVESSEMFDWSGSGPFYLYVRRADGSSAGPYGVDRLDDFRLVIDAPLDFDPVLDLSIEPPHLLFGIGYAVLVTDISPNGEDGAAVEAENYDARVYADDDNSPPLAG